MEDFTYEDIHNLIRGLVIAESYVKSSTKFSKKYINETLQKVEKANESLRLLRKKLEFKDDPYTWDYGYDKRQQLKNKL